MKDSLALFAFILPLFVFGQWQNPEQVFEKYTVKKIAPESLLNNMEIRSDGIVEMTLDRWQLQLESSAIFSPNYKSVDERGKEVVSTFGRPKPFSGYTFKGGRAAITIAEHFIYGFIEEGEKTYYIEPLRYYQPGAGLTEFIIYEIGDIKYQGPRTCGFSEAQMVAQERDSNQSEKVTGLCYDIEYGICNDFSMFDKYGSIPQTEAHVIGVTNNVNTNYNDEFDDELRFVISGQYTISVSGTDPWSASTNAEILLPSFRVWAVSNLASAPISIAHDVASLWSNRDFDGATVGLAYTPGTCNINFKYNILQDYSTDANSLRVLTAHELGHNLNADHDEGTNIYIMSPTVNNTNDWTATSVTDIENYYNSQSCFSICVGSTPQVNFDFYTLSADENSGAGVAGPCDEPYTEITRSINISIAPDANVVVDISVDPASTATELFDFELITTSVTFTPGGALSQDVIIRVYDDQLQENPETIILPISIASGTANLGPLDQHTLTILGADDQVSANCCTPLAEVTYGSFTFSVPAIFRGGSEDAKTRIIIKGSDLQGLGLTAGLIDQLSLYVFTKSSTSPFSDFRIGFLEVTESDLSNTVPWYSTTEVFNSDVTTVASSWNDFNFSSPFDWDGVSNIYIDFCFNNSSAVGQDNIVCSNPGSPGIETMSFFEQNGGDACGLTSGSYTFFNDLHPHMRFRQLDGAQMANDVDDTSSARIRKGETAHFYTATDRLIASIKNIGSADMDCVDVTIRTVGNGKSNLPFGSSEYSDKTFEVAATNDAYYELTLYFDDDDLDIWGVDSLNLNFIQSSVAIAASTVGNSSFINTIEALANVGLGGNISYRTSVYGDGFFALTNEIEQMVFSQIIDADIVIEESGKGILLKNGGNNQYIVQVDINGNLVATLDNAATASALLSNSNLILETSGKGLILPNNSGNYAQITIDNLGMPNSSEIVTLPAVRANLETGHLGLTDPNAGIVFKNGMGECWKLIIDELGEVVVKEVGCP